MLEAAGLRGERDAAPDEPRGERVHLSRARRAEGDQVKSFAPVPAQPDDVPLRRALGGEEGDVAVARDRREAPGPRVEGELALEVGVARSTWRRWVIRDSVIDRIPVRHAAVALHAETGDLALDEVTRGEEDAPVHAVARRGAGEHEVAWTELGDLRGVGEDRRQVEEHVRGRLVLPGDPVVPQGDAQVRRVADELGGHQVGTRGQERGGVLGGEPVRADRLEVPAVHQRPGGDVVADRVAGHVVEGVLAGQVPGRLADDRGELKLPVVVLAAVRQHDVVVGPGEGAREAREDVGGARPGPLVHHALGPPADLGLGDVGVVPGQRQVGAPLGHDDVDDVLAVVRARLQDLAGADRAADVEVRQVGPVAGVRRRRELVEPALRVVPVPEQVVDRAEAGEVTDPAMAHQAGERCISPGGRPPGDPPHRGSPSPRTPLNSPGGFAPRNQRLPRRSRRSPGDGTRRARIRSRFGALRPWRVRRSCPGH